MTTVLTVPMDFTDEQRSIAAECATKAGFKVVQILNEPAAAILAYGLGQETPTAESITCLVFRCGGTSTSVSVARITSGFVTILGAVEKRVGGEDLTKVLADFLAGEFQR